MREPAGGGEGRTEPHVDGAEDEPLVVEGSEHVAQQAHELRDAIVPGRLERAFDLLRQRAATREHLPEDQRCARIDLLLDSAVDLDGDLVEMVELAVTDWGLDFHARSLTVMK